MSEASERWLLFGLAALLLAALAPLPVLSPDAAELLAGVGFWRMGAHAPDLAHWQPLYPMLLWPLRGLPLEQVAWTLNLVLAAGVVGPLHQLATRISGSRLAGRVAALAWVLLPAVREHAAVPDARPLFWLLAAGTAAGLAEATRGEDGRRRLAWALAFCCAALAPLARSEGQAALPLLIVGALALGMPWQRLALHALPAALPTLIYRALRGESWGVWGSFYLPWLDTWSMTDFLALNGVAVSGSDYRSFTLRAVEAGLETPPSDPSALLTEIPVGLVFVTEGLIESVGVLGFALGLAGLAWLVWTRPPRWRGLLLVGLGLAPVLALAPVPMTRDQATSATNLLFAAPLLLVPLAVGVEALSARVRRRALRAPVALGLALLVGLAAELSPLRSYPPSFLEDSRAAEQATAWLQAHPPVSGEVTCSFSGRHIVRRAGLWPTNLPSPWEDLDQPELVLISSADSLGEDGGRGLELLEDPAWEVAYLATEDPLWVAILRASPPAREPDPPASSTPAPAGEPRTGPPDDPSP